MPRCPVPLRTAPRIGVLVGPGHNGGDGCTGDLTPGNGRCDLGPGTYGDIIVRNGDGTYRQGYKWCDHMAYRASNFRNWTQDTFRERQIGPLFAMLPELAESGTLHPDAWYSIDDPYYAVTDAMDCEAMRQMTVYVRERYGVDLTTEFDRRRPPAIDVFPQHRPHRPDEARAHGLAEFVARLVSPRVVWLMVPAGDATEQTMEEFAALYLDAFVGRFSRIQLEYRKRTNVFLPDAWRRYPHPTVLLSEMAARLGAAYGAMLGAGLDAVYPLPISPQT